MILVYEILILSFTFLLFFFSLSEIAVISANRSVIHNLKERKIPGAAAAEKILLRSDEAVSMILIGSNISSISATAFITFIATEAYHMSSSKLLMITAVQTVLFLLFCEVLPKIVARVKADTVILFAAYPLWIFFILFKPMIQFSLAVTKWIRRTLDIHEDNATPQKAKDEIDALFRLGSSEGVIDENHSHFVNEILSLHKITVVEAMTPTIGIISIEIERPVSELFAMIEKTKFSRIPVYRERVDNIIGYVYYRDILDMGKEKLHRIDDIMRKPVYVPMTKTLYSLYKDMQKTKNHIVFVVSEHGAVAGVVTREDIAEEIVGEIQTRDHPREDLFTALSENRFIISGIMDVDYFARIFRIRIEKKGFETVGGLVSYLFGYIPDADEKTEYQGLTITVDKASPRAVEKILVYRKTRKRSIITDKA